MYLIVGGNSEIGAATARLLASKGADVAVTTRRPAEAGGGRLLLDFDTVDETWQPPAGIKAACIFVAVARLAACEADPESSSRVNIDQTLKLVRALTRAGVYTLFLSTNQVFDGSRPHVPADAALSPVSAYGKQKARTEAQLQTMMSQGKPVGILRLAKVASPGMALLAGWQEELKAGRPVRAFRDMTMAPTPTAQVAEAIARMLEDRSAVIGQLTGPNDLPYDAAARQIAARVGADPALVHSASGRDFGVPVGGVPANTTLDSSWIKERYGIAIPPAEQVVDSLLTT